MKWWFTYYRPILILESGNVGGGKGQEGQGLLGTVLLASSSWFTKRRKGVEKAKAKDVDATGEENQFKLTRLIALINERNETIFSLLVFWCFFRPQA